MRYVQEVLEAPIIQFAYDHPVAYDCITFVLLLVLILFGIGIVEAVIRNAIEWKEWKKK